MEQNYQEFAVALAKEAGEIIRQNFGLGTKKEWKNDNSPLTVTDTAVNRLVIEKVKEQFPEHSILGEEDSYAVEGSRFTWVCDPIDGTVPFSAGIPVSTFSLALCEDGIPILGVIYEPYMDRLFTAEKGQGAFLNGQPIHVSGKDSIGQAYIECMGTELVMVMEHLLTHKAKVSRMYCLTYPGFLVAAGEYDAVLCYKGQPWDIAALKVIVEEAGGKVTDRHGNEQRYDQPIQGAVISNGLLNDELVSLMEKLGN